MSELNLTHEDRQFMARAVELGRRGWGGVHPNPMVGCVLVRDGDVVAEGFHEEFGGPHAEVVALERAGERAAGCTAYVSLEPCRHEGKTPACTRALISGGVVRVVYGAADPGEDSGGGAEELAAHGIEVVGPVFDDRRAWSENPAFFHWATEGTPFIAVKLALSLDGAIASAPGVRTQLTGAAANREVHRLRGGFDAIMVGSTTARVDDPLLTVREVPIRRAAPVRIVLDSTASLSSDSALFRDVDRAPVWVFCRNDASETEMERLEAAGAKVHPVPAASSGVGVSLTAVQARCAEMGVQSILCEGGGVLASELINRGLARRLYALVAPVLFGAEAVRAFHGPDQAVRWEMVSNPRRCGDDTLLTFDRVDLVQGATDGGGEGSRDTGSGGSGAGAPAAGDGQKGAGG
jgi:diaminohydroxyphosphoribosylaminopyrimidine deaminase/5-amino-6-(5-phosphoribosylamino)uracil reductase